MKLLLTLCFLLSLSSLSAMETSFEGNDDGLKQAIYNLVINMYRSGKTYQEVDVAAQEAMTAAFGELDDIQQSRLTIMVHSAIVMAQLEYEAERASSTANTRNDTVVNAASSNAIVIQQRSSAHHEVERSS